jgi:hypothetical protein
MAIAASDIKFKLSILTGDTGNAAGQPDPNASLGKYISTTELSGTALNNLWDDVSGAENEAGPLGASAIEYRCIFIHNAHGSLTLQGAVVYVYSQVSDGASVAIAVESDRVDATAIGASAAQALNIANVNTAPAGLVFTTPTTLGTALTLGAIPNGYCRPVWIKRTAANSAAVANDGCVLRVSGGTAA